MRRCAGQQKSGLMSCWSRLVRGRLTAGGGSAASRTRARNAASSSLAVRAGSAPIRAARGGAPRMTGVAGHDVAQGATVVELIAFRPGEDALEVAARRRVEDRPRDRGRRDRPVRSGVPGIEGERTMQAGPGAPAPRTRRGHVDGRGRDGREPVEGQCRAVAQDRPGPHARTAASQYPSTRSREWPTAYTPSVQRDEAAGREPVLDRATRHPERRELRASQRRPTAARRAPPPPPGRVSQDYPWLRDPHLDGGEGRVACLWRRVPVQARSCNARPEGSAQTSRQPETSRVARAPGRTGQTTRTAPPRV